MRFRPHQGINKFNNLDLVYNIEGAEKVGFRPHQGINKFNPVSETVGIYWF